MGLNLPHGKSQEQEGEGEVDEEEGTDLKEITRNYQLYEPLPKPNLSQ